MRTKHLWISDLETGTFLANSQESVRVMGILTQIGDIPDDDLPLVSTLIPSEIYQGDDPDRSDAESSVPRTFTIDDGTASVTFWVPSQMIGSSSTTATTAATTPSGSPASPSPFVELGRTYDCVLKLRQAGSIKRWFADTLILVTNPVDEHLRWIQLSHHARFSTIPPVQGANHTGAQPGSSSGGRVAPRPHLNHEYGYPTRKRDASEAYRLICVQAKLSYASTQQQQQRQQKQKENHQHHQWNQRPNRQPPPKLGKAACQSAQPPNPPTAAAVEGVLLEDLALVLQTPVGDVQKMLLDLQIQGQVYQNERGEYLPL